MIHLYGVVGELDELPAVAGVDGAPLERRRIEGLELIVSQASPDTTEVSEEALLRHATVVEELMARTRAVLPAQFGSAFPDEHELSTAVRTKAAELGRGLDRVSGCVEFGLRVLGGEREVPAGVSGREYMSRRLAEAKSRERLLEELHEPLARLSRAEAQLAGGAADLLRAAYLVPDENAPAFRERVCRLELEHPELTVVCTGPWPPYTFAGDPEGQS